jgi:hypothetical protein
MADAVADGGGGAFEGIDPHQLAQLMTSLKNGVGSAQPVAGSYLGRFSELGLDTSRIARLQKNYGWAQGQQPMLQRRYDLASHQPSGQWVDGMATSGASYLDFGTPAQAQAAGAQAAQQFKDGKITAAQFYAQLAQYSDDPDWATGAMKALGPDYVRILEQESATQQDPTGQQNMKLLAIAVAAAMANGVTFPYSDDPEDKGSEDPSVLAPLLQYANFPPQVLATLGKEAMAPGNYMYAPAIWKALAANPQASAMFIQQNAPYIVAWIHAGDHGGGLPDDQSAAFLAVLKAGTIGVKGTDPKLGGQALTALIKAYDANPGAHAPGSFQALYGDMIKAYWPDVMFSLTSKAGGKDSDPHGYLTSPDGMQLSPDDWAPFIDEAMRDPKTGAMLLDLAHTQGSYWSDKASQQAGGADAGDAYAFDAGVVDGYFDYQAKKTYDDLVKEGKDAGEWKDKVAEYLGDAVDIGVDVVVDPGEAAKTITVGVTKEVIKEAAKFGVDSINTDNPAPPAPQYSSWQGSYASTASNDFNNSTPANLASNPDRQALVNSAQGQPFVVNGKIIDPAQMNSQQLTAYNNWLSSQPVATYLIHTGGYAAWQLGYNASVTQESFGGG